MRVTSPRFAQHFELGANLQPINATCWAILSVPIGLLAVPDLQSRFPAGFCATSPILRKASQQQASIGQSKPDCSINNPYPESPRSYPTLASPRSSAPTKMATKLSPFLLRDLGRPSLPRTAALRVSRAAYSSEAPPPPPLLAKLKNDLKTAMRAKDTNRLSVLRSVLAETLNASKTDKPIKTDVQLVSLLQKSARKAQEAAAEARDAGREDLVEKEEAQQRIFEEYAASSGVEEMGEPELRKLVETAKAKLVAEGVTTALRGQMIKRILGPGGLLDGVAVDKKLAAKIIMELSEKTTDTTT